MGSGAPEYPRNCDPEAVSTLWYLVEVRRAPRTRLCSYLWCFPTTDGRYGTLSVATSEN